MIAVAVVAALFTPATPAAAEGGAPLTLTGTASLPEFPCRLVIGQPPCEGSFSGVLEGQLAGAHFDNAWDVTLDQATVTAAFAYSDGSCVEGQASGSATVTADTGNAIGTYGQGDEEGRLPRAVTGLTATADFEWNRDALTARLFPVSSLDVSIQVDGLGWVEVMNDGNGAGVAAFVPHTDTEDMPDCLNFTNTPAIDADVAATLVLADPA